MVRLNQVEPLGEVVKKRVKSVHPSSPAGSTGGSPSLKRTPQLVKPSSVARGSTTPTATPLAISPKLAHKGKEEETHKLAVSQCVSCDHIDHTP